MKEENIFWVGTQPLQEKARPSLADDESFVAQVHDALESTGHPVAQFVSALGPYGTWLVAFQRENEEQRILWNGKTEQLILQTPLTQGGWVDRREIGVDSQNLEGFIAGIHAMLTQPGD